jgi:zinc protease
MRVNNSHYGHVVSELFIKHPYRWSVIGSMEDLDNATLEEFQAFNEKFYIPNNAVLTIAGDIDVSKTKELVKNYFGTIPKEEEIPIISVKEEPIEETIKTKYEDPNIQIPLLATVYRTPLIKDRDSYVLNMISSILTSGKSSRLYKKLVDDEKKALEVGTFNYSLEDYGAYIVYALPLGETTLDDLLIEVDEEIIKLQTDLISENDYQKLQNIFENQFVNSNSSVSGIAELLSEYYVMYENTNLINSEIEIYRSITYEDIRSVAKKYLNKNQRLELEYLPKPTETESNEK